MVGLARACAAHAASLMTPWVLKPPHPRVLSQQASSIATLRFLLPPHVGCGLTSRPPQSDVSSRRYAVSLPLAGAALVAFLPGGAYRWLTPDTVFDGPPFCARTACGGASVGASS